jgi:nitrile hydratase beta subunit
MNGVHDMGGMHGFGPIERDEEAFHAEWEKRVHALLATAFTRGIGPPNIDASRHALERMQPSAYLQSSYYERWLAALQAGLVEEGVLDEASIDARARLYLQDPHAAAASQSGPSVERERAPRRAYQPRSDGPAPRFAPGDQVMTRNIHTPGHTRLPRYARGKRGFISRFHGIHVFPDTNAHGLGPQPQPLYSVRFEAGELWGAAAERPGSVFLDLWESYLEKEGA